MSDMKDFIQEDGRAQDRVEDSNFEGGREDAGLGESEVGKVSQSEVSELKDSIGGGQILDESEGYTRSSNKDANPMRAEQEVDAAVDEAEAEE